MLWLLALLLATPTQEEVPAKGDIPPVAALRSCLAQGETQQASCLATTSRALLDAVDRGSITIVEQATPENERTRFGLSARRARAVVSKSPVARERPQRIDRVVARVTQAIALANGHWRFALDEGSQWQTLESGFAFMPRAGETVTVMRAALGSYRAKFAGQSPLLVERVR